MGNKSEFQGCQEEHGDYVFSVARDCNGNVWGLRRLLNGDKLAVPEKPETVARDDLPSVSLREHYDILVAGGLPPVGVALQSGRQIPTAQITNYGLRA